MSMLTVKDGSLDALEGQVIPEAILRPMDVAYLNFAREEHRKLESILLLQIIPALGGYSNELACDIARHLEQIRSFSGNFCWKHRHLGNSYDANAIGRGAGESAPQNVEQPNRGAVEEGYP